MGESGEAGRSTEAELPGSLASGPGLLHAEGEVLGTSVGAAEQEPGNSGDPMVEALTTLERCSPTPLRKVRVLPSCQAQGLPSLPFPMHMLRRDEYLIGECLHLDSIPGHCLAWVVCSLHQHLLTQLGQPALHHTASTQARRPR